MPDYDASFKIVARASGRQLAQLAGFDCRQWEPIGGEVQATERLADRAFRARRGRDRCVVYMEAYTRWDRDAPWSVLAKSGLLSERERLPTLSLVYVLLPRGYQKQRGTFRLKVEGKATQQVWFQEVCFWKEQPEAWWEEAPGLMALYPLCRHRTTPQAAVAHAAQNIAGRVADSVTRADLLVTLAIFGRLRLPQAQVLDLIGRQQMIESPMYQEILAEGRAEGRAEEKINTTREHIRDTLGVRFGPEAATEFADALRGIGDLSRLSELFRVALGCRRLTEFRKAIEPATDK
jgi:hypothetical protein